MVKDEKVFIVKTDKSSKLTLIDIYMYEKMGSKHTEKDTKIKDAYNTMSWVAPILKVTPKDHKVVDQMGMPKDRPICEAKSSMNGRLSDFLSDVLQPIAIERAPNASRSTEDMLAEVGKANLEL